MLKKRLIPVLLLREGQVVQSIQFKHTNVIHANVPIAVEHFNKWAPDELIVIDASPSREKRKLFHSVISALSRECFVPLTVGGFIDGTDEVRQLLRSGADKVVINTQGFRNHDLIRQTSSIFGSQCVVAGIDVRLSADDRYEVVIDHGKENTGVDPVTWAQELQQLNAGEIYLTSIDRDGSKQGYDLKLLKMISEAVSLPLIAFGGVGNWDHLSEAFMHTNVDAVAAANIFHYVDYSAKKAKDAMKKKGIDVR